MPVAVNANACGLWKMAKIMNFFLCCFISLSYFPFLFFFASSSSNAFTCLHNLHLSLSLYICQEGTFTHTQKQTYLYAYACYHTKTELAGGWSNLRATTIIRSVVRREMPDVSKRTGPVTLESGSSATAATSTPSSSSSLLPHIP